MEAEPRPRRRRAALIAVPCALLVSSAVVWQASSAALSPSTSTGTNAWAAGRVDLAASSSGTALFSAGGIVPGDAGQRCVTVTYRGDLAAAVRLSAADVSGRLAGRLGLVVEEGRGGDASCTGFTAERTLSAPGDTLATFAAAHGRYSDGVSGWRPTGAGQSRTFRVAWTLSAGDDAQGLTAGGRFVWEARPA